MEQVLSGLHWKTVLIYLDNVIFISSDFTTHVSHLWEVFDRLRAAELKLKFSKCVLLQPEVTYLGHVVDRDRHQPGEGTGCKGVSCPPWLPWAAGIAWPSRVLPAVHIWVYRSGSAVKSADRKRGPVAVDTERAAGIRPPQATANGDSNSGVSWSSQGVHPGYGRQQPQCGSCSVSSL